MTRSRFPHEHVEELVAAHSLGGLDEDERRELLDEMARHGAECQECRNLVTEYSEAAGLLAFSLVPVPVRPDEEERLIAAARSRAEGPGSSQRQTIGSPRLKEQAAVARFPSRRTRRWVATVAVAASIAAVGGAVGYALAPRTSAVQSRFVVFLSQPGTRIAVFPSHRGQNLAVAFRPGTAQGWVVGSNLSAPSGGRVYELWFRNGATGPMQPAGTFVPSGQTVLAPAMVGPAFDTLAVSIEPAGGSQQPTSAPIFLTTL